MCNYFLRQMYPEDSVECMRLSGAIKEHYCEYKDAKIKEDFVVWLRRTRPWTWHILQRTGRNETFIEKTTGVNFSEMKTYCLSAHKSNRLICDCLGGNVFNLKRLINRLT